MTKRVLTDLDGHFRQVVRVPQLGGYIELEVGGVLDRVLTQSDQVHSRLAGT